MALPRVAVFSLGGTISSVDSGGKGVEPTLTGEALVSDVPEIAEVAEVSAVSFRQAASGSSRWMTSSSWRRRSRTASTRGRAGRSSRRAPTP